MSAEFSPIRHEPQSSRKIAEISHGIKNVDVTTAMHLFDTERTFQLVNELNRGRSEASHAKIEVYPTIGRTVIEPFRIAANKTVGFSVFTPDVTVDKIREWQKQYPRAKVSRVHLPFSYDNAELWHRPFFGEKGLMDRAYQIAWIAYFGPATNERGIKIAEELNADGQEVAVNAHANVLEGFIRDGRMDELKQRIPVILAENERQYNSPVVTDQQIVSNPLMIARNLIGPHGADGLLLGVDHGFTEGIDMRRMLRYPEIRNNTQVIHLAQTSPSNQHDVIAVGDPAFEAFLKDAAKTPFAHEVRAALDYSPLKFLRMNGTEEFNQIARTMNWIMSTQNS